MAFLIYENIGAIVAPFLILVFHFQYALFHVSLMYLGGTAAVEVLDALIYLHVNERSVARSMAREAENDNTNDVSYARANDLDYYCYGYCYCSFVCHTDNHVESGNRILPKGLYHIHCVGLSFENNIKIN